MTSPEQFIPDDLSGSEALRRHRLELQRALGEASVELSEVSRRYNDIIAQIIKTDEILRELGVDKTFLENKPMPNGLINPPGLRVVRDDELGDRPRKDI